MGRCCSRGRTDRLQNGRFGETSPGCFHSALWPGQCLPRPERRRRLPIGLVGGTVYFFADDGTHGSELWKTDGTGGGTALVKDIFPGADSSEIFAGKPVIVDGLGASRT
jgi:ELWxxDGT repeat protein